MLNKNCIVWQKYRTWKWLIWEFQELLQLNPFQLDDSIHETWYEVED